MGISGKPSASRVLVLLAAVVVAVGGVSLLVTGAGRKPQAGRALPPVAITPTPLNCKPQQLSLVGSLNECASIDSATGSCNVSSVGLIAIFNLTSSAHQYELDMRVSKFVGAGEYAMGEGNGEVEFYDATGSVWTGVAGGLTVIDQEGRSGTIEAVLEPSPDSTSFTPLSVTGPWSCG